MTLLHFLGPWLYWPLVICIAGFTAVSVLSNVSLIYTEVFAQIKEIRRLQNERN